MAEVVMRYGVAGFVVVLCIWVSILQGVVHDNKERLDRADAIFAERNARITVLEQALSKVNCQFPKPEYQ